MAAVRADVEVRLDRRSQARVESELNSMFRRMSGKSAGFAINDKSFTQPLGRITASANEFTKSLEASNARVIAFGASVGVINAVTDAFKGLVMETIQFEKTLSEINVVMNSSASALRNFGDELFNVSRNTAQGFNVVAEAALEFSRQGLTMEETLRRTNDALILTRLTSLKATEAVSGLTAAVNAFGSAGLTTTEIIDKLAAVDVNFAVSSEDLIHALERTGAVAISAGVELDNLIGLVTALQQSTARGGSVIGNGLKTIFTRIQRPASLRQLEEMNIAVRDLTGAVLPADKILQNIAKTFNTLSQAQQSNLVQFSAGIFQANIFRATLADLSKEQNIFADASKISADAAGNAAVKNAALNKTLAAMVSQTSSSVKELAGALGEIMLEDDLKSWTKGFKSLVDSLTGALDGGEGKGSDFAKGFFKGLGNVLTGPVAIAIGVVFVKLLANVAKFAGQSLKDVLGVTSEKEKLLKMENGIIEALSRNKHIQQALNNLEGDRLAQEEFMLKVIEAQTNAMQAQKRLAQSLARPLMNRGITPDMTASNVPAGGAPMDLNGDGQYDTFTAGGLIPKAVMKERRGAIKGGYNPGAISTMNIDGVGNVIYNKAETIKRFPGFKQPAIMPPQSSRAGKEYRGQFAKRHGFDPYASHGLVPNFASIQNNASNMKLMGTGQLKAPMYVEKQIRGSEVGEPMSLSIKTKASGLKGKNWKRNQEGFSLGELLVALGVDSINTTLPFDFVPGTVGPLRKLPKGIRNVLTDPNNDAKGDGTESIFLSSQAGEGYTSTGGLTPLDTEGAYSVDKSKRAPNANLDAYKIGDLPIEVKAGELDLNGVVKKSIRRYSNTSFRNSVRNTANDFLYDDRPNAVFPDMTNNEVAEEMVHTINHLQEEFIIERLSELAKNGNWSPVGMSQEQLTSLIQTNKLREHMRNSGLSASDTDKELLNSIGFSAGLIPDTTKSGALSGGVNYLLDSGSYDGWYFRPDPDQMPPANGGKMIKGSARSPGAQSKVETISIQYDTLKKSIRLNHPAVNTGGGRDFETRVGEQIYGGLSPAPNAPFDFSTTPVEPKGGFPESIKFGGAGLRSHATIRSDPHSGFGHTGPQLIEKFANEGFLNDISFKLMKPKKVDKQGQIDGGLMHAFLPDWFVEFTGQGEDDPNARAGNIAKGRSIVLGDKGVNEKLKNTLWDAPEALSIYWGKEEDPSGWPQKMELFGQKDLINVASGFMPNFTSTNLYRGTSPKYQKAIGDIPNPPQFLFDKVMSATSKKEFIEAVKALGISHSMGAYSGSYNDGAYQATLEQMRGYEKMDDNQILHGGYVYPRPVKGGFGKEDGVDITPRHQPSGFVSRTTDKAVAQNFAKALIPGYEYNPNEMGQIEEKSVPNKRIFDQEKLEKYIDRFGLENVKKSFKKGMRSGSLKDVYLNLHKFRPKVQSTDPLDMFSPNAGESERSIGMSSGSLTTDEKEITHIWSKRSPFFGEEHAGYVPNFLTFKNRKGGGSPIPVPDSPGLFSKEEVEELKAKGFQRNDSDGWFKADPVPLKYKSPTDLAPFGKAEPVAINYLNKLTRHDRSLYSIPNAQDDNADLDQLGQSLIDIQKNPAIIGYDSSQNKLQLIEGNHRVAALNKLNKDKLKTMKMYSGLHAYVAGVRLDDVSNIDFGVGLVNQRMPPRKIPEDAQKALKDPYRRPGQFVQGFWKPSEFGIPNFADAWDNHYFNEKAYTLTDEETGTTLRYKNLSPGYADITHTQQGKSGKKGGAFRNFNKLVSEYDSIGSGMLVPQRAGIGATPWAKLVHMFPQIKNRIQDGLETMGDFRIDETEIPFKSLVGLKRDYGSFVREMPDIETFVENYGKGPFFDEGVALENLSTYKVKGKGDGAAGFQSKGLVPSFFNLNRRNLSDGDKMSDRQRLLRMWQEKMGELKIGKEMREKGVPEIDIRPVVNKINVEANTIWDELQKLIKGENYEMQFPFEIPNFAVDLEKVRQLAIRGVGGEKENAQRILNNRSIKSKNMFHDIVIDSFLDNPNQDYPPGTSIVDHLIALGYDEKQIRSAAKNPKGYRRAAMGLIPNFSRNPLRDAINREKAAGVPESMIRLDKSSQLMGPQNPMGLAVINTRDEPRGVQQGINRSRAMGIDPKKHGLQVPNFANSGISPEAQKILKDFMADTISGAIEAAIQSAGEVEDAATKSLSSFDFDKAGLGDSVKKNIARGGGVVGQEIKDGNVQLTQRTSEQLKQYVSGQKLDAEGKFEALDKSKTKTNADKEQMEELSKIINGLSSLEEALDSHSSSMTKDTQKYIKLLASAQGGIKETDRDAIKKANDGGRARAIEDALEQGSKDPNRLRSAADQARAELSKAEETWKKASPGTDKNDAKKEMKSIRDRVMHLKKSEDAIAREAKEREGGLQRLFYFQSMLSMAGGMLEQYSTSMKGGAKALADFGIGITSTFASFVQAKELGREAMEAAGVKQSEGFSIKNFIDGGAGKKAREEADEETRNRVAMGQGGAIDNLRFSQRGGALGGFQRAIGGLGRGFTRMIPVIGQLYTGFTAIDESVKFLSKSDIGQSILKGIGIENLEKGEGIMALFKNNSERAATSIEKLTKASDVAAKALEAVESSSARSIQIAELESKGKGRTLKQDRELHRLKIEEYKANDSLIQIRSQLQDKDVVGVEVASEMTERFKDVNIVGRNTEEVLRKLNATLQKQIVLQQSRKSFNEKIEEDFDFTNWEGILGIGAAPLAALAAPFTGGGSAYMYGAATVTAAGAGGAEAFRDMPLGQDQEDFRNMKDAMEVRADTLFSEFFQGLQGGDEDKDGRTRSDSEKTQSLLNNMEVFARAMEANLNEGPEAMKLILRQLEGSSAFGEQSTDQVIRAFSDYVDSGADMQDNIGKKFLSAEGTATKSGFGMLVERMRSAAGDEEQEKTARDKALIDMRTIRLQERIFRNYEIQLDRTMHNLKILDKQITVDQEIEGIKENLLSEYGLMLNSTKIENDHARKTASRQRQHEIKTNEIRQKLDREATKILEQQVKLENLPGIVTKADGGSAGAQMSKYAKAVSEGKDTNLGKGSKPASIRNKFMQTMADSGMGKELSEKLFAEAKSFVGSFGEQAESIKDASQVATLYQESMLDVADVNKRYAVLVLGEIAQLIDSGDNGKARRALIKTFASGMRDLETANSDLALEAKKSAEELRNTRIKENTFLGAGLLSKQMSENNDIENQPGIINKQLEGEAASQSVRNKINKERIETLLKSKNFEMKILADLEAESVKSTETSVTSLKNAQIKNQIFSKNQDILISSISRAMLEQEELAISNKEKEVKLATLTNSERLKSFAEESVKSEILDAEINARITEAKRKVLENAGYARMLAEAQVKAETESAKISTINAEQKLIAQVANASISELVKEELSLKLSSARTESLKAAESALQLELNKEQTKKMQKANYLLEISNKFTEMKNAEFLASRTSDQIRGGNLIQRQTDQFNMVAQARSAVDMAALSGNPDDKAAAASQIAQLERSITGRSGALTMLAQKMAEVEVAASSLSADLAGGLFDGVRSGFGTLLTDIATGAESAGDAWKKFGLGVAKQLLDRVMEHNIDKMMSNLTYAFTGVKNDPAGQQKLLASVTSKQTTAIKALTEKIEALRRGLSGDITAESGGETGGPLASIDHNKINELMSRMGSNAGSAANGLAELESRALSLANFFEGDYTKGITNLNKKISEQSKGLGNQKNLKESRDRTKKGINELEYSLNIAKQDRRTRKEEFLTAEIDHKLLQENFSTGELTDKDIDIMIKGQLLKGMDNNDFRYETAMNQVDRISAVKKYGKGFDELDKKDQVALQEQVRARMPMVDESGLSAMQKMKYDPQSKTFKTTFDPITGGGHFSVPGEHNFMKRDSGEFYQHKDRDLPQFREDKTRVIKFGDNMSSDHPQGGVSVLGGGTFDLFGGIGSKIGPNDLSRTNEMDLIEKQLKEFEKSKANLEEKRSARDLAHTNADDLASRLKIQNTAYENQTKKINENAGAMQKAKDEILTLEQSIANLNSRLQDLGGPKIDAGTGTPTRVSLAPNGPPIPVHVTNSLGPAPTPAPTPEFFGGKIQHFHDGGFVRGEPGRDKVPAMLTAGEYVVPKEMMQAFKEGGKADGRLVSGLKGTAQMVTMALVTEEIADAINGEPEDKEPTFDMKKLNTVNIGSDVNITRGDPRMSARAMAKDPVMKEYKDYLLKKASYDVQKKNEKFQERMGMLGTVVGAISSFAISQTTELLKEPINNLITKGDNFIRGNLGFGKHSESYEQARKQGIDIDYSDLKPVESTGFLISNDNKAYTMSRNNVWTLDPGETLNHRKGIKKEFFGGKMMASGGQIPAMLTAGEMYVPAEMAKRIGYDSLDKINKSGIIDGPGGIDNVGPVGLNPGDFIIRKSSTDKLLNTNPNGMRDSLMGGGFTKRAATGYYEGGMAGETATVPVQSFSPRKSNFDTSVSSIADQEISSTQEKTTSQGSSATTNNINVSVKIDSSGKETVESSAEGEGSYQREKDLSMKIKSAVLEVIRQEKRVGGELS